MRNVKIPIFFDKKLANSDELLLVQQYLSTFDEWYHVNACIFFREYTDHGIKHIHEVLSTAEKLLTEDSKERFSAADCALLICSTLLHDFAMHLQEESFVALVTSEYDSTLGDEFGDKSWGFLWKEYISEMHRLPESDRENLFGSSDLIPPPNLLDIDSWKQPQYRYIGEFIRRHHPRLAYEISRNGIPGTQGTLPIDRIATDEPNYRLSLLAGIVARSHGMKLRETFDVLNRNYHLRLSHSNSHPVYVMILLRISDYVQLQYSRAPNQLLKIKKLKSPLSQSEWGLHDAIEGVSFDAEPDPEVLRIQVDPRRSDISSYLKTQRLLASIQYELDNSWAVLGEIYGRFPNEKWGITIRRIRSNIEDKDSFGRNSGFIPEEVKFTSANTELTKLLIKPLYGDYPEIAVRELVQNAIDACRERAYLESGNEDNNPDKYSVKVELINNSDGSSTLRVSDNGIGMTLEVLKNYFLKAGSSFRTSLAWKKHFVNDNSKSEVLRTGRFGVGALAAFLIADDPSEIKLSVHSRHFKAKPSEAVSFETTLSDAPISINYREKSEIGTTISVTTSSPPSFMRSKESEEKDGESWDWYCLDWPRVERSLSTGKVLPQKYRVPTKPSERYPEGLRLNFINVKGFSSICWYYGEGHSVICNGIRVIKKEKFRNSLPNLFEEKTILGTHTLNFPNISVMDKDGLLPLTLDRLRLDFDQIPFIRELREDVVFSFVLGLAVSAISEINEESYRLSSENLDTLLNNFEGMDKTSISWVIKNNQISPFSNRSLNQLRGDRIIEIYSIKDLKFIKSPESHTIILTKKSIFGNIKNNIGSQKFLHFLSDRHARDRLERLFDISRNQLRMNFESYHYSKFNTNQPSLKNNNRSFIKHLKNALKLAGNDGHYNYSEFKENEMQYSNDMRNQQIVYALRFLHERFGGHQILSELFSGFEKKMNYSYLDEQDGRVMLDIITAISDATPKLHEGNSADFSSTDCPVEWDKARKSAALNNEEWFMASWVLENEVNIGSSFIGDTWHALFGNDFIPLPITERQMFFNKIEIPLNSKNHLTRWQKDLKEFKNGIN